MHDDQILHDGEGCKASKVVGAHRTSRPTAPVILLVNFALVDRTIVFRTCACELNDIDAGFHDGWRVLVVGTARVVVPFDATLPVITPRSRLGDREPACGDRRHATTSRTAR